MPDLKTIDGVLFFENSEYYFKTISIISTMTEKELDEWETKLGFISVRTIQNKFYQELENLDEETVTNKDIKMLVSEYSDYVEIIINNDGEEEIRPIIENTIYSSIANSDFLYLTYESINKVIKDKVYYTDYKENIDKMILLSETNYMTFKNIKVFEYTIKPSKDISIQNEYSVNYSGCRNDRKVKLKLTTSSFLYNKIQYWDVTVTVRGYTKLSCIWRNYKTGLNYKEVYGQIYVNYTATNFAFSNLSTTNDYKLQQRKTFTGSNNQGYTGFIKSHGKASSTGVGNHWAILDSGY